MNGISDERYEAVLERINEAKGHAEDCASAVTQADSCETLADLRANVIEALDSAEQAVELLKIAARKVSK